MPNKEISKIRLPDGTEYNIKDEELRHMLNVLLGIEQPNKNETVQ